MRPRRLLMAWKMYTASQISSCFLRHNNKISTPICKCNLGINYVAYQRYTPPSPPHNTHLPMNALARCFLPTDSHFLQATQAVFVGESKSYFPCFSKPQSKYAVRLWGSTLPHASITMISPYQPGPGGQTTAAE